MFGEGRDGKNVAGLLSIFLLCMLWLTLDEQLIQRSRR